ncbi:OsmC family protein [Halomonas daqiaonensis]|uniref:Osmotically inducible protein OsmC n=1 Tax=Halomonas daqiaonensis TaxID=650850 RepID=A0A1H7V4X8_9GAMM|nr:OsmC family protein [Halomonas daqiaonensis]SEM04311.1 osmotically inducible protein OsmC [Halomonas daqiaonensis]
MSIKKSGSAVWQGGLQDGKGTVSTQSGVIQDASYSFAKRFESEAGTNPEELLGAAHASCYSMALSLILGEAGLTAERIATEAKVSLEEVEGGFAISAVHLDTVAKIPGADEATFQDAADKAKEGCPVSKLFNAEITLQAKLEG